MGHENNSVLAHLKDDIVEGATNAKKERAPSPPHFHRKSINLTFLRTRKERAPLLSPKGSNENQIAAYSITFSGRKKGFLVGLFTKSADWFVCVFLCFGLIKRSLHPITMLAVDGECEMYSTWCKLLYRWQFGGIWHVRTPSEITCLHICVPVILYCYH